MGKLAMRIFWSRNLARLLRPLRASMWSATTVSRRVKRLEAKLGARIFKHQGLRLHATHSFREAMANVEAAEHYSCAPPKKP